MASKPKKLPEPQIEIVDRWNGTDTRSASGAAQLLFSTPHGGRLYVTIPLPQLGRLYRDIQSKLQREPELFARGSKKDHS